MKKKKKETSSLLYVTAALLSVRVIEYVGVLLNYGVVVQKSSYGELV